MRRQQRERCRRSGGGDAGGEVVGRAEAVEEGRCGGVVDPGGKRCMASVAKAVGDGERGADRGVRGPRERRRQPGWECCREAARVQRRVHAADHRDAERSTEAIMGVVPKAKAGVGSAVNDATRLLVVSREEAPPPIATTLFHLTPRGEQLRPVLADLIRWGLPLMAEQDPKDAVRSRWLAGAIELMLDDHQPEHPPITVELRTGEEPIVIEARDGSIHTQLGPAQNPDATLTGAPKPILGLLLGMLEPTDAKAAGVTYEGDPQTLDRIRGLTPTGASRRGS